MAHPTKNAERAAAAHQAEVMRAEQYSSTATADGEALRAAVHARQDLVLIYDIELAIHKQLVTISRGVWLIALIALFILLATGSEP